MVRIVGWMVIGACSALGVAGASDFVAPIEQAHRAEQWQAKGALETRIEVDFGGRRALEGRLVFSSDAGRSILEPAGGARAVFDGSSAWVSPNAEAFPGARFHLLTWPYFAAVATKLRDPGTAVEVLGPREELGRTFDTARLTFAPGTGDAPDDWYILYREAGTNRLAAMAYIVTFGTDKAKAEAEPHAIVYEDFVEIDGVPISTRWTFHNWTPERGIHGEPIGEARLLDPRWVESPAFVAPAGAVEIRLPN